MWDERLTLAADLYESCETGADIGTDHAYLPLLLLTRGTCKRMLLCDLSEKAIGQAAATVKKYQLEEKTKLILADGLKGLNEPCGCISVMGMGGETMVEILRQGQDKLQGAVLVLSAHTEQDQVRRVIDEIGYHITQERICQAAGRFYIVWRAEPGRQPMTEQELTYGSLMYTKEDPLLVPYLEWRIRVMTARQQGMKAAGQIDEIGLARVSDAVAFYTAELQKRS